MENLIEIINNLINDLLALVTRTGVKQYSSNNQIHLNNISK